MPCADGGRAANGEECPYTRHAMQTLEGHQAWDIVKKGCRQLRMSPSGKIVGLEIAALISIADAQGYCLAAITALLPHAEAGLLQALWEQHGDS